MNSSIGKSMDGLDETRKFGKIQDKKRIPVSLSLTTLAVNPAADDDFPLKVVSNIV